MPDYRGASRFSDRIGAQQIKAEVQSTPHAQTPRNDGIIEAWKLKTYVLRYQWKPQHPTLAPELLARLDALEISWTNHGGLLRLNTIDGPVELHDGAFLDIYPDHRLRVPAHVHDYQAGCCFWRGMWVMVMQCACGDERLVPDRSGPVSEVGP